MVDIPQCGKSGQIWINNIWKVGGDPLQITLNQPQESLIAHGSNFAIAPQQPHLEYVTLIEQLCQRLNTQDAKELRMEVNSILRYSHHLKI